MGSFRYAFCKSIHTCTFKNRLPYFTGNSKKNNNKITVVWSVVPAKKQDVRTQKGQIRALQPADETGEAIIRQVLNGWSGVHRGLTR